MLSFRDLKKCNKLTLRYVVFKGPDCLFEQGVQRGVYSQSGINIRDWFYYIDEFLNARSCRCKLQLKRMFKLARIEPRFSSDAMMPASFVSCNVIVHEHLSRHTFHQNNMSVNLTDI